MKPYYEDGFATIYHGDCREILPQLGPADVVVTDPVWPQARLHSTFLLAGSERPWELLREAVSALPTVRRLVVHLGCNSDPRFLTAIPECWPFFRACTLEYVRPHYKGRLLYTHDVAYVFGDPPQSSPGHRVIPGRYTTYVAESKRLGHPTPRKEDHVRWLVNWFADGLVLDPFMGSGTTLGAAKACGKPSVGIEVEERYCEMAVERCRQMVLGEGTKLAISESAGVEA